MWIFSWFTAKTWSMHAQGAANLCWEQELTNHTRLDSFSVSVRTGSLVQSCSVLCNLMDCSPPNSSVLGIFQVRILGAGYHLLFQVIFPTRGSNLSLLRLLRWQADSLPLSATREGTGLTWPDGCNLLAGVPSFLGCVVRVEGAAQAPSWDKEHGWVKCGVQFRVTWAFQFLSCDHILWQCKCPHMGRRGNQCKGTLWTIFATFLISYKYSKTELCFNYEKQYIWLSIPQP